MNPLTLNPVILNPIVSYTQKKKEKRTYLLQIHCVTGDRGIMVQPGRSILLLPYLSSLERLSAQRSFRVHSFRWKSTV